MEAAETIIMRDLLEVLAATLHLEASSLHTEEKVHMLMIQVQNVTFFCHIHDKL